MLNVTTELHNPNYFLHSTWVTEKLSIDILVKTKQIMEPSNTEMHCNPFIFQGWW